MKLGFSIVNYNQEAELLLMLGSLREVFCAGFLFEICVVDNSNTISESLKTEFQKCLKGVDAELDFLKKGNVGYLKGLQAGCSKLSHDCDFIFLCNSDLHFLAGPWSEILSGYLESSCLLAPDIVTIDGKVQNPNRRRRLSKVEMLVNDLSTISYPIYETVVNIKALLKKIYILLIGGQSLKEGSRQSRQEIWLAHGSCMIVNVGPELLNEALDFDLFLWGEEAVIAGTLRRSGIPIFFEPSIKVRHDEHSSTRKLLPKAKFEIWKKSYAIYRDFLSD